MLTSTLKARVSIAALATALMLGAPLAQDAAAPASEPAAKAADLAETEDSGTIERSTPDMAAVIEKLMELGAKPVHTLSVEEARAQPTPADAVMPRPIVWRESVPKGLGRPQAICCKASRSGSA